MKSEITLNVRFPCYTTKTGIRIGCAYQPPVRQLSYDEIKIQSALLGKNERHLSLGAAVWVCLTLIVALAWIAKP